MVGHQTLMLGFRAALFGQNNNLLQEISIYSHLVNLWSYSYKVQFTFITKYGTIKLFILILEISAIIHQLPCCYVVTTSKTGL